PRQERRDLGEELARGTRRRALELAHERLGRGLAVPARDALDEPREQPRADRDLGGARQLEDLPGARVVRRAVEPGERRRDRDPVADEREQERALPRLAGLLGRQLSGLA